MYGFGVGEPDFPTPAFIVRAATAALEAGATRYTAVTGTPELKAAICDATERDRGWRPSPSQITVTCGAKHALFNLALALYEPGDEVVIPAPFWVSYPEQVRIFGAEAVIVPTREVDGFRITPEALEAAITPRTKAVILCTPSNPTGAAYPREQLEVLAKVFRKSSCYVVVDEIYGDLVYDGFQHCSLPMVAPDLRDRILVIDGVSKTYAMTGWRIGWSITPEPIAEALNVVQGQSTTNPAAVSQAAAVAALRGPRDELAAMRTAFQARRDRMVECLRGIPRVRCRTPEGAFYVFADVSGLCGLRGPKGVLATDEDLAMWFLEEAKVATVAGTPFGAPGYLRLSYACSEAEIEAGVGAMRKLVESAGA